MNKALFIGLMSGTSLDGVDAALVEFEYTNQHSKLENQSQQWSERYCQVVHTHSAPFSTSLRSELLSLQASGPNELERAALAANELASMYALAVDGLLTSVNVDKTQVTAIGCHGQTIRHRPELGFTLQIGNASLLAELSGIKVISDFRSRDIAAGGQGAPLVPAFHQAVFGHASLNRVLINIGGIANLSYLPHVSPVDTTLAESAGDGSVSSVNAPASNPCVIGFDSGPGNMLMDAWAEQHLGKRYDESGRWGAGGQLIPGLLDKMLAEPFFALAPPKSTGRDLFSLTWLQQYLDEDYAAQDVQRTLLELTASTIATAVRQYCYTDAKAPDEIYVCGGGAHNDALLQCLQRLLHPIPIQLSDKLGIAVESVEAAAFAWLAKQALAKLPGNLPAVTGAKGLRILGAVYA